MLFESASACLFVSAAGITSRFACCSDSGMLHLVTAIVLTSCVLHNHTMTGVGLCCDVQRRRAFTSCTLRKTASSVPEGESRHSIVSACLKDCQDSLDARSCQILDRLPPPTFARPTEIKRQKGNSGVLIGSHPLLPHPGPAGKCGSKGRILKLRQLGAPILKRRAFGLFWKRFGQSPSR